LSIAACAAESGSDDGTSDDALTSDATMISAVKAANTTFYARLPQAPSKELGDALIAAAQRGVEVRTILPKGSDFDTQWLLQQHLESSGVDVDVRTDHGLDDVVLFGDGTALVTSGSTTRKVTGADATAVAKRFTDIFDVAPHGTEGAPLASGSIAVHPMPESKHDRIVALFSSAKSSIDLSIYQLQDRAVVHALIDAAKRHVAVRVMLEPKTVGAANYDAVSKELSAGGVNVQATPPRFDSSHNVDHAKFAIIDQKEILLATGNLVRSGLGGDMAEEYDNRDFWVEDARDASIGAAHELFEADWARKATPAHAQAAFVITPENADDQIGKLVDAAKQQLVVYNQSLEDDTLIGRLVAAKQRGVDVQVLLGYQPGFGGKPPANQAAIDKLKAGGVKADFLRKHYLHAKAIVSDGNVYIGSQNFTNGGLRNNRELGIVLDDAKAVEIVVTTFKSDL
jgi:phosphatidylserine/phosphatidylglycerophosphate/cardiolipin synthase-like enzyme